MKKKICFTALILLITVPFFSQTPLPYFTGWDNAAQQTGWQLFRKGSLTGNPWLITTFGAYTAPGALIHTYPVGGVSITSDWYVSPAFNFTNGGRIDSLRHYYSGFGTPQQGDTVSLWLLTGSPDPALASSKILLHDFSLLYSPIPVWEQDTNIIIPPVAGQSYIAFQYATIVNWLDVSFDNLAISGGTSGINSFSSPALLVYPNPVSHFIAIENYSEQTVSVTAKLFSADGKEIMSEQIPSYYHTKQLDVSELPEGLYFLNLRDGLTQMNTKICIVR